MLRHRRSLYGLRGLLRKGKERRAFLLLALEASWPIGEAPSPRTLGDSSEGIHPISEDARRLLGEVDDEHHMVFDCPALEEVRVQHLACLQARPIFGLS